MSVLTALERASTDLEVEIALTLALCERINTPHSLAVSLIVQAQDFLELKTLRLDAEAYVDDAWNPTRFESGDRLFPTVQQYRMDRLVSRMLIKSALLTIVGVCPRQAALDTFEGIEKTLEQKPSQVVSPKEMPWLYSFAKEFNRILDNNPRRVVPFSPQHLEQILERGRLGPGASALMAGGLQSSKLRGESSVGASLKSFAGLIKGPVWYCRQRKTRVVSVSGVSLVPKNVWTDRTIVTMPVVDMYLQLGLGDEIADILRFNGCDIRDQRRNQRLAESAYERQLATIDLSSASSWFCYQNIESIFPPNLVHLMDLVRPKKWAVVQKDGSLGKGQPFYNWLPMGAGHTFALQTLYYLALLRATVPRDQHHNTNAYGDDLVVPAAYAREVMSRLEQLGFQVNQNKSYVTGSFYESCGRDYLKGYDVTPFYLRKEVEQFKEKGGESLGPSPEAAVPYRIQLANKLRRWAYVPGLGCDAKYMAIWERLIKPVAKELKRIVPSSFGDLGLTGTLKESGYKPYEEYKSRGYEGEWFNIVTVAYAGAHSLGWPEGVPNDQLIEDVKGKVEGADIFTAMTWTLLHRSGNEDPNSACLSAMRKYGRNYRFFMDARAEEADFALVREQRREAADIRYSSLKFINNLKEATPSTLGCEVIKNLRGPLKFSRTPIQWDETDLAWVDFRTKSVPIHSTSEGQRWSMSKKSAILLLTDTMTTLFS